MARGLAGAGAQVILNGRNEEKLRSAARSLRDQRLRAEIALFDVTDPQAVKEAIDEIEAKFGAIDVLVNNAGIQRRGPLDQFQLSDWDDLMKVNVNSIFYVSRAVAPGYFDTPLNKALIEDPVFDSWLRKRTPAGRWGKLEDLYGIAIFLASSASDFINGQTIYVDGGITAVI